MKILVQSRRSSFLLAFAILSPLTGQEPDEASEERPISFAAEIRPILSDKCFACHGPDEKTREAGLRLDLRESAIESSVLEPGLPEDSELLRRVTLDEDDDERMPPKSFHKELDSEEIELIRLWITQGAAYEQHWAYRPLEQPQPPQVASQDAARVGNPIDAFILRSLHQNGLTLSEPADRATLIRRLYLDLLGMPPTPEQVQQFVDASSGPTLEETVDALLRDPRFGERLAVHWLDLVRYADTIGYHSDNFMEVSAYRDYVIQSFNDNKPFDQFTIEQLAGDLLPNPSQEQLIASGYNRLLQTTEEGGAQAKEYIAIYAADRVRNVSGVWLGQTLGCAQCHDHKYDPFTMKDFYSLAAFFADIDERAVGKRNPNYTVITAEQQQEIDARTEQVNRLKIDQRLAAEAALAKAVADGQQAWEQKSLKALESTSSPWQTPVASSVEASGGVVLQPLDDGSLLSTGANPEVGSYTIRLESSQPVKAVRLEVFPDDSFPRKDGFSRGNGNFVLTEVKIFRGDQAIPVVETEADYEQKSWPVANAIDGDPKTGWAIDGHHKSADRHVAIFRLDAKVEPGSQPTSWRIELHHDSSHPNHLIGRFRIGVTDQPTAGFGETLELPEAVAAALKTQPENRSKEERKTLEDHYRSIAPELADAKQELAAAEKALDSYRQSLRTMLISKSLPEPRMTRVLPRGNWLDESGEVVAAAVPEFLPHQPIDDRQATRLDLAQWIVSDENPLTARNFVNRLWKLFYGRGLSRNLDDLGGQGQAPTHPELLDWLAVEFRDSGWDIKHMVRLMVTSSTYQQTSVASAEKLAKDPLNRLYGRQGRWRLEAEFVRDTALSISGLLANDLMGGPSVKPYQPTGYWQHLNFPQRTWEADRGINLYRRGLYTFWCRTFLHPSMLAFDAPSREECTAERSRSNIPQQALVLMNDPIFVEASRVFAARIIDSAADNDERIRWAFRKAMSRDPQEAEIELLQTLYEQQSQRYRESPEDAQALLQVGQAEHDAEEDPAELAAWTQVARAILNAYETTSRF
jgi:hypothetical protein